MADPVSFKSQVSNVVVTVMGLALWWFILLGSVVGQLTLVANIILIWGLWGTPSEILGAILERVIRKAVLEGFELLIDTTTTTTTFYGEPFPILPWSLTSPEGTVVISARRSVVLTLWGLLLLILSGIVFCCICRGDRRRLVLKDESSPASPSLPIAAIARNQLAELRLRKHGASRASGLA